jgi:spermidine synthase
MPIGGTMERDVSSQRVLPTEKALDAARNWMTAAGKLWFLEIGPPGRLSLTGAEGPTLSVQSEYQRLEVVRLSGFGLCMILDGRMQLAESDEWIYHELLVHPACVIHGDPRRVVVLGGGDGCALRELLRYRQLEEIVLVDIDKDVLTVSKEQLRSINRGALSDPRVQVVCADAMKFLEHEAGRYDLIISDLTEPFDPTGGGEVLSSHLYSPEFYRTVGERLTPEGIFVCQTGGLLWQPDHDVYAQRIIRGLRGHFPHVASCYEFVPSFAELWSITLAASRPLDRTAVEVDETLRRLEVKGLRYYDGRSHQRAFTAPLAARSFHE